jgi:hypothetical protein
MGHSPASRGQIAGPLPVVRPFRHPGPDRVQDDIPANFEEMAVFLDQNGLVPALEQVTGPAMAFIEELRINAVQLSHAEGKVAVRGLDKKMIMVGHKAIGMTDPVVAFVDVLKGVQKVLTVCVILENRLLLVPAGGHMIDCAGVFDAERTGHGRTIAEKRLNGKKVDLTL